MPENMCISCTQQYTCKCERCGAQLCDAHSVKNADDETVCFGCLYGWRMEVAKEKLKMT